MRAAFSLIELIFVIVLMGVLAGIGFYMSRPDYTRQDAQFALLKLKEARYRAIGYDDYNESGCVTLTQEALSSDTPPRHEIRSTVTHTLSDDTVCFDALGRPHAGSSVALETLIRAENTVTFAYGDKNTTITLYPQSGYAIIPCNN